MPRELWVADGLTEVEVAIDVAWGRGTHVQMATLSNPHAVGLVDSTGEGPQTPGRDGQYVDLTRDSINRLIRVLRKARDQAFGVDE